MTGAHRINLGPMGTDSMSPFSPGAWDTENARAYRAMQDARNPNFMSARASMKNAETGEKRLAIDWAAQGTNEKRLGIEQAAQGTNQFRANTELMSFRSGAAANRADLELQLAQMRRPSSYDSIMSGFDEQRNMLDSRYNSALSDIQGRGDQQVADYLAMMQGVGDASRERIYRDATADRNSVGARLGGTGLYNSTVLASLQQGVNRNRNEAIGQLDEGLRREKAQQLSELTSRALDRRQQMTGSQLGVLGNLASQRMSTDASLRGQERDTSAVSPALLNLITHGA